MGGWEQRERERQREGDPCKAAARYGDEGISGKGRGKRVTTQDSNSGTQWVEVSNLRQVPRPTSQ